MIRLRARCREAPVVHSWRRHHLDRYEALSVEMRLQCRHGRVSIVAGDKAQLAVGDRLRRDSIDWPPWRTSRECEHIEDVAGIYALSRRQPFFAPPVIDGRSTVA